MMRGFAITVFLLLWLVSVESCAQDTTKVNLDLVPQAILGKIDHEVSLTDRQMKEVYALLVERSKHFREIKKRNGTVKITKSHFDETNAQALGRLRQVLTPEQFILLMQLREESRRQKAAYREEDIYKTSQDIELDF